MTSGAPPGSSQGDAGSGAPLEVGVVLKPHGLRGELKVKLHFAESDSLEHTERVLLLLPDGKRREWTVTGVRPTGKGVLLRLEGVVDCEGAEALRGSRILVERSALPPLEPGEYYLADLVGCSVQVSAPGDQPKTIGVVRQVRPDPSIDTLVIETPEGKLVEQPMGEAWLGPVDVAGRRIELLNEDGLIL